MWLEDPVDPYAGESFTVLLSALRPVGWVVDPEYEALMASKLIESNRNRRIEAPSGQCGAASIGRQASSNHSASDAEHALVVLVVVALFFMCWAFLVLVVLVVVALLFMGWTLRAELLAGTVVLAFKSAEFVFSILSPRSSIAVAANSRANRTYSASVAKWVPLA